MNAASKILYLAPSGGGKTTGARNLDPVTTRLCNIDRKEPPIFGWTKKYKTVFVENPPAQARRIGETIDLKKSNYVEPSTIRAVKDCMEFWENDPGVETVLIDTLTMLLTGDYVDNAIGKDYTEYQKMGKSFYQIMDMIRDSAKNYIVMAHTDEILTDRGDRITRMSSPGKMIESFKPPGFFTTVLMGYVTRENNATTGYVITQSQGGDPAKSPAHILEDGTVKTALQFREPNDLKLILQKLDAFRKGE